MFKLDRTDTPAGGEHARVRGRLCRGLGRRLRQWLRSRPSPACSVMPPSWSRPRG